MARFLEVPVRFFTPADLVSAPLPQVVSAGNRLAVHTAAAIALAAAGAGGQLIPTPATPPSAPYAYAMALAPAPIDARAMGRGRGWLAIVGTGPGAAQWLSPEVRDVLHAATDWVGYTTYLNLAEPLRHGQQCHPFDNRAELERARMALDLAAEGRAVALVSSGDPGIYAMAAAVFEVLEQEDKLTATDADMRTVILVGSSQTRLLQRHDGSHWVIHTASVYHARKRLGRHCA